ncbi:MAG: hypothetical protein WBC78_05145 [Candidatus Sulfotelmatobacter sp.]
MPFTLSLLASGVLLAIFIGTVFGPSRPTLPGKQLTATVPHNFTGGLLASGCQQPATN